MFEGDSNNSNDGFPKGTIIIKVSKLPYEQVESIILNKNELEEYSISREEAANSFLSQKGLLAQPLTDDIVFVRTPGLEIGNGVFLGLENQMLKSLTSKQVDMIKNDQDILNKLSNIPNDDEKEN